MELSSPRFKALATTFGVSFWFFIITSFLQIFTIELFAIFVAGVIALTQIFALKLSKGLDIFASINTKFFLGILFIFVISLYGIFFKVLKIDLLRTKNNEESYWLQTDVIKTSSMEKQY